MCFENLDCDLKFFEISKRGKREKTQGDGWVVMILQHSVNAKEEGVWVHAENLIRFPF